MVLCFGTLVSVLMKASLSGTTNRMMVYELVRTIDPDNQYDDNNNDSSVSKLVNCRCAFPNIQTSPGSGAVRSSGGSLTNVVALARGIAADELSLHFDAVIALLDEDKKITAVNALLEIIAHDNSISGSHKELFEKCMGTTAAELQSSEDFDLKRFLGGLFLYTVLTNGNTLGKNCLVKIRQDDFYDSLPSRKIQFKDAHTQTKSLSQETALCGVHTYLSALRKKYNSLRTLMYKETPRPFYDFYVCNDVEYRVTNPKQPTRFHYERIHSADIKKLNAVSPMTVLSGTGGLGKSMMMRHLMINCIDNFREYDIIPFFLQLKNYVTPYMDLTDYIFAEVSDLWSGFNKEQLLSILSSGKALLLLDGLDEIHSSQIDSFTKRLNSLLDRYPDNSVVISSRPYSNFMSFSRFTVLQLRPFSKEQALSLINKLDFRPDAPTIKAKFRSELDTKLFYSHKGFSDNPLLLTIMLMTFEDYGEVASKMHIFYEEAYQVLAKKHDANKDGFRRALSTGWTTDVFADYFSFFCAITYTEEKVRFTLNDLDLYFRNVKKHYHIEGVSTEDFICDLCNNLCLMYQDGTSYAFTHRSFQEYFCARYFSRQKDKYLGLTIDTFDHHVSNKKDDNALQMLYEMIPSRVEEFIIVPYLDNLIKSCEEDDGIWTFLNTLYPDLEYMEGDLSCNNDFSSASALYDFILDHYEIQIDNIDADNFPGLEDFTTEELVWREDIDESDDKENLPYGYEEEYGEPEVIGRTFCFDWNRIRSEAHTRLMSAIENENSAFMKEYHAIKNLLSELKRSTHKTGTNMFDLMD